MIHTFLKLSTINITLTLDCVPHKSVLGSSCTPVQMAETQQIAAKRLAAVALSDRAAAASTAESQRTAAHLLQGT